jgi:hypothetical protein
MPADFLYVLFTVFFACSCLIHEHDESHWNLLSFFLVLAIVYLIRKAIIKFMTMSENHFFTSKINEPKNKLSMAPIIRFIEKTICCMNKNELDFGFGKMVISLIAFFCFC